jgi:hypothetical protein
VTPKDIGVFIESYLKYARPDRIIIESEPSESVSMVCAKLGARCSRMEKIMGSYTYERAMLAKGIATCENNKK